MTSHIFISNSANHLVNAVAVGAGELLLEDAGGECEGLLLVIVLTACLHHVLRVPHPPPGRARHVGLEGEEMVT